MTEIAVTYSTRPLGVHPIPSRKQTPPKTTSPWLRLLSDLDEMPQAARDAFWEILDERPHQEAMDNVYDLCQRIAHTWAAIQQSQVPGVGVE